MIKSNSREIWPEVFLTPLSIVVLSLFLARERGTTQSLSTLLLEDTGFGGNGGGIEPPPKKTVDYEYI